MPLLNVVCPICAEVFQNSDDVYSTKCGHLFHHNCMNDWQRRTSNCPQCREPCRPEESHKLYLSFDESSEQLENQEELQLKLETSNEKITQLLLQNSEIETNFMKLQEQYTKTEEKQRVLEQQIRQMANSEENFMEMQRQYTESTEQVKDLENRINQMSIENEYKTKLIELKNKEIETLRAGSNQVVVPDSIMNEKIRILEQKYKNVNDELQKEIAASTKLSIEKMKLEAYIKHKDILKVEKSEMKVKENEKKRNPSQNRRNNKKENVNKPVILPALSLHQNERRNRCIIIKDLPRHLIVKPLEFIVLNLASICDTKITTKDLIKVEFVDNTGVESEKPKLMVEFNNSHIKELFLAKKNLLKKDRCTEPLTIMDYMDEKVLELNKYDKLELRSKGFDRAQYSGQREQQSIDLKKLNFSRGNNSSQANTKLGTSSSYMWRTITSGRQTVSTNDLYPNDGISPPTTSHKYPQKHQQQQTQYWGAKKLNSTNSASKSSSSESYSSKINHHLLNDLLEEYLDCLPTRNNRWREEVFNIWQQTTNKQQFCVVYYILMDYLHLSDVKRLERDACANIFIHLMSNKALNKTTFQRAYEQFALEVPDLLIYVPKGWCYVFQFLGPLLHERLISFNDIWYTNWRSQQECTERFVIALVNYFTKEFGANYMRDLWHKEFKLDHGSLFKDDHQQWQQFVINNKLQFLYDIKAKPEFASTNANKNNNNNNSATIDQHVQRLEILLSSPNDSNLALDYINTNVNVNSYFLNQLTKFLCCDYATTTKQTLSGTSRTSSATTSKNSSTCSNISSSSNTKNLDSTNNVYLNINAFRNNCLPLLRLCLDGREDHELACLDAVVGGIQQEYDLNTAYELICGIFDIFYHCEVIAKESFEKWYNQRILDQKESKFQIKRQLAFDLKSYMQKIL